MNKVRQKLHGPDLKNLVKKVVGQCYNFHACKMLKAISKKVEVQSGLAHEDIILRGIPAKAPGFGGIY